MPGLDSEALDFRVASESFAAFRKLPQAITTAANAIATPSAPSSWTREGRKAELPSVPVRKRRVREAT